MGAGKFGPPGWQDDPEWRAGVFDHLHLVGEQYSTLRRYTPEFLDVLRLKAAPAAQAVLDAIDVLREVGMVSTVEILGADVAA